MRRPLYPVNERCQYPRPRKTQDPWPPVVTGGGDGGGLLPFRTWLMASFKGPNRPPLTTSSSSTISSRISVFIVSFPCFDEGSSPHGQETQRQRGPFIC